MLSTGQLVPTNEAGRPVFDVAVLAQHYHIIMELKYYYVIINAPSLIPHIHVGSMKSIG